MNKIEEKEMRSKDKNIVSQVKPLQNTSPENKAPLIIRDEISNTSKTEAEVTAVKEESNFIAIAGLLFLLSALLCYYRWGRRKKEKVRIKFRRGKKWVEL